MQMISNKPQTLNGLLQCTVEHCNLHSKVFFVFFFFDYAFLSLFLLLCVQRLWSSPGSAPFPRIRSRITSSKWREIAPPATSELSVFCVCTCCMCASLLCKSSLCAIMHRERGEREMMSKTVFAVQEVGGWPIENTFVALY